MYVMSSKRPNVCLYLLMKDCDRSALQVHPCLFSLQIFPDAQSFGFSQCGRKALWMLVADIKAWTSEFSHWFCLQQVFAYAKLGLGCHGSEENEHFCTTTVLCTLYSENMDWLTPKNKADLPSVYEKLSFAYFIPYFELYYLFYLFSNSN